MLAGLHRSRMAACLWIMDFGVVWIEEVFEHVEKMVVDGRHLVQRWVAVAAEWLDGLHEDAENLSNSTEKLPPLVAQPAEIGMGRSHIGQWDSELTRALDHVMGGVPACTRVQDEFLVRKLELHTAPGIHLDTGKDA